MVTWEAGNIPLGGKEREYIPSDEELIASELGGRISAFLRDYLKEVTWAPWRGHTMYPPNVEYDHFTFRHVDVMGSGRFFYISPPERMVIDFSAK